ncbi:lytic transglycosylase domain-containing protein [Bryobacter aggregatus]|uniref:lytic transglycosylase domain-containing protein n=1 Tax=Bryobacter aggregatus TaxID=360054 RepID=UPI00192E5AD0|nr:lytic transglycosylase domain-containing protein [Bryobacter aggregatus]
MRALIFAFSLPLWSAKFVVLQSGFQFQVERWERSGDQVLLHRDGGVLTIPASDVAEYLEEADAPKPVVAAPPQPVETIAAPAVPPPTDPKLVIAEMAAKHGLPEKFVASVARAESAFQPNAVSNKGAIGVMQLMPGTARDLGVDPNDVRQNIEGGTKLLRDLLVQYQNDPDQVRKALAAYNAGAGAVAKYGGVPPYRETQNYVEKVLRNYQGAK